MNKGFTVYVSPLEMDSTAHRLVELPMEQEKLDALQLELNTGSPSIPKYRTSVGGNTLRSICQRIWI